MALRIGVVGCGRIHEKSTKWSKKAIQTIEIHYSDIGCIGGDIQEDKENPRQEISA